MSEINEEKAYKLEITYYWWNRVGFCLVPLDECWYILSYYSQTLRLLFHKRKSAVETMLQSSLNLLEIGLHNIKGLKHMEKS